MIITIQPPFDEVYNKAYLVSSQGRNSVCLYSSETGVRNTVSYARYLMSVHLGRVLTPEEEVDHIDDIKNNDVIQNLQILSKQDNIRKYRSCIGRKRVRYQCPVCEKVFDVRRGLSHLVITTKKSAACSRTCGGRLSHLSIPNKIIFIEEFIDNSFTPAL